MGPGLAEHLHDAREQSVGADAHVHRFDREPQGIDADQRRISRSQAAHASAALVGHVTAMVVGPRWSSMRIGSAGIVGAADIGNAMKPTGSATGIGVTAVGDPAACTQRRWR